MGVEGKIKTFNHKEGMNDFTHLGSKVVNELVVLRCMENLRGEVNTGLYSSWGPPIFQSNP